MGATFLDLFSAKVALELGVMDAERARATLKSADEGGGGFLRTLEQGGPLGDGVRPLAREQLRMIEQGARRCLYLKGEDTYRRLLAQTLPTLPVPELQACVKRAQQANRRLGTALLEARLIDEGRDRELVARCQQMLDREGQETVRSLREQSFEGIASPSKMVAAVVEALKSGPPASGRSRGTSKRQRGKAAEATARGPKPPETAPIGTQDAAVAVETPRHPIAPAPPRARTAPPPLPTRTAAPPLPLTPFPGPGRGPLVIEDGGLDSSESTHSAIGMVGTVAGLAPPLPHELVGSGLEERFIVERKLGEGGMGAVYLAWDKEEDPERTKPLALKVVRSAAGTEKSREAAARFKREILATSLCGHENIIEIHAASETKDGSYYMAMEYLEGEQLDEVMKREGALSIPRIVDLIEQVLAGMVAYHAANIVHRDIKPQNFRVWREPDGRERLKIMDFGIARVLDADETGQGEQFYRTISGKITGSPAYLSPESITEPDRIDHRADLYSLGITIYRLAANRLPFVAREASEFLPLHLYSKPPSLIEIAPDCPPELEELYYALLEKVPTKRPADASEALEILRTRVRPALMGGGAEPPPVDDTKTVQDMTEIPVPLVPRKRDAQPDHTATDRIAAIDVTIPPDYKAPAPVDEPPAEPSMSGSSKRVKLANPGESGAGKRAREFDPGQPTEKYVLPDAAPPVRRGGWLKVILILFVLLLGGAAGGAYWAHRTGRIVIPYLPKPQ